MIVYSQAESIPKELSVPQTGWVEVIFRRIDHRNDDGGGRDNGDGRRRCRQSRHGRNDDGGGNGHRCQHHGRDEEDNKDDAEKDDKDGKGGKGGKEQDGGSCRRHRYERRLQ